MTVINTNIKGLFTQAALQVSGRQRAIAMEQLSTGKRINSSKDDAAGLAISSRMNQAIKSLNQAVRNAGDAISLIQTTEGATNEITTMLQRMSELTIQASNATNSPEQRGYLDLEFQQLKKEIVRISDTTEWNGFSVLNGTAGARLSGPASTPKAVVDDAASVVELGAHDLKINGVAIRAAAAGDDTVSLEATTSSRAASAIATAAAINASTPETKVSASVNGALVNGEGTSSLVDGYTVLKVNGVEVYVSFTAGEPYAERRQNVVAAINATFDTLGVKARDNGNSGIELSTPDGRNLTLQSTTNASEFGLSGTGVNSDPHTYYGTVTLTSEKVGLDQIQIEAGDVGANFLALGFTAGTFSHEINTSTTPSTSPHMGRLSFQIGASANQVITIDMADFGKDGVITGALTHDVNDINPAVNIKTVEGANNMVDMINHALDQVSAVRSTMGAVMNRLEHVIDNLTNVSNNTEASRSRIEDADYAAASTELARTGIMQQAATAVLAQANTDQQTVLKLLQ